MSDDNENSGRPWPPATGRLLHLADYDHGSTGLILTELREYWNSLRQGRAIPTRADVEPQGIRRALDYAFILERVAPGAARFRLAGRHLINLMGMEVRGMPLCSFLNPSSRGRLSDVLETVFRAPQIAELSLHAAGEYARPELRARMLLMPLRSDLGDITRALGCLIAEGDIGSGPRRFDLISDKVMPIFEGAETVEPSPSSSPCAFAEKPADWQGKPRRRKSDAADQPPVAASRVAPAQPASDTPETRRAAFRIIARND